MRALSPSPRGLVNVASLVLLALAGAALAGLGQPAPPEGATMSRTTGEIRREGNHLVGERSRYLRQHAHNPIDWYPWGEEALARARDEDKPIFLSVGYASCHWCHVMDKEVFQDDIVADFLNHHFVAIKVDREERPDIDAVYMEAVQLMTRGGGWPMSLFLTPDRRPFFAGTYFPRDQFLGLARQLAALYRSDRGPLVARAKAVHDALASWPGNGGPDGAAPVDAAALDEAARAAVADASPLWGGTQGRMKFPTPLRWMTLLHRYRATGEPRVAAAVRGTLDAMASGGIYDHVGGGFHRYTVDERWIVPHFEKMLYDNAQLASLYTEAAAVFHEPRYAAIARDTLDFLLREMRDPAGGFYASFDADSGGEEGSFYVWTPEEITAAVGEADGAPLAMLLGVTPTGNFAGRSVLTRRVTPAEVASAFGRGAAEVTALFARHRETLRAVRAMRVAPGLDKKVVTAWNGLTIAAFAQAYRLFGEARYRDAARRCADFLWTTHRRDDGRLLRASNEGRAVHEGILDDYAFLAYGFVELYQATGEVETLRRALALVAQLDGRFRRPEGGFFLTAAGLDAPLGRTVEVFDHARPSGASAALHVLLPVAALTGDRARLAQIERALADQAGLMKRIGFEMAWWFDVAAKLQSPYYEVVIAGGTQEARALRRVVDELLPPQAVLVRVPASGPDAALAALLPPTMGKTAREGRPTAYVCRFGSCQRPTSDPATLRAQLGGAPVSEPAHETRTEAINRRQR